MRPKIWERVVADHPMLRPYAGRLWYLIADRCPANRAEGIMTMAVVLMVRANDTRHARPLHELAQYLADWRLPKADVRRLYRGLCGALDIGGRT